MDTSPHLTTLTEDLATFLIGLHQYKGSSTPITFVSSNISFTSDDSKVKVINGEPSSIPILSKIHICFMDMFKKGLSRKFTFNDFGRGDVVKDIPQAKVIPNWFNPAHQGLPSSRTGPVVAVGRLEKVKGFDLLINAWVNIKEELNIIGSGKELMPLQELIAKLGLADRIKILTDHSYESIEDIYKNASGLIVSSLREGGPRTVLEAINHNIPVLGTNVGIMPQIIPRDLLAEAGNQVSLTALLEEMIPLLPQLDVSAIKIAMHENYSLENACIKTKEVYFSL